MTVTEKAALRMLLPLFGPSPHRDYVLLSLSASATKQMVPTVKHTTPSE